MIDLRGAIYCVNSMKESGSYHGEKIGRVVTGFGVYNKDEIVLFREQAPAEEFGSLENETLVVEKPISAEWIKKNRMEGSLISTICTTISVPVKYVEEIQI